MSSFAPYGYELGIAVGAGESIASSSYEIANIAQQVNFINVMTYDFAMASDGQTGFNAPQWAIENSINYWINQGNWLMRQFVVPVYFTPIRRCTCQ